MEIQKLSLRQKVHFMIFGKVFLGMKKREGWTGYNPVYLVRCKKHGPFETHPQGYEEKLNCSKCSQENFTKIQMKLESLKKTEPSGSFLFFHRIFLLDLIFHYYLLKES